MSDCRACFWRVSVPAVRENGESLPRVELCSQPQHADGKLRRDCEDFETAPKWAKRLRPIIERKPEVIEVTCKIIRRTEKAILVESGSQKAWLPLSQIVIKSAGQAGVTVQLPGWLAKKLALGNSISATSKCS